MSDEIRQLISDCESEGVVLALDESGKPVMRGRKPSPSLLARLKSHKPAVVEWLKNHLDDPLGRWGEVPPAGLRYRVIEPEYTDEEFNRLTSWALRQPPDVRQWVQKRSCSYFEKTSGWHHRSYDYAASLDLLKWQLNKEQLPEIP